MLNESRKANGNLPGMGGLFNHVNHNLYHYAGNNPIIYTDPTGMFDKKQFCFAALQTFGGVAEVAATCSLLVGTGGLSAGLAIYGVIDGIANIEDGIIGMVAASKDQGYRGYIAEATTAFAKGIGMDFENAELLGDVVGLSKAVIDMDILNMPNLAKGLNSGSKIVKGIDTIVESGNRISTYEAGLDVSGNIIDQIKTSNSESNNNSYSQQNKDNMDK